MKISKFTSIQSRKGETFLFNSETEGIITLDPKLKDIYKQYADNPVELKNIHPAFYDTLVAYRFIVPKNIDEGEDLIKRWEQNDKDHSYFGIIINPTLNCNLRCWYCYESHKEAQKMNEATRKAICLLIKNKAEDPKLKLLNVSFFGGEPLLYFKVNVLPILSYAAELCQAKGITLHSNFTTNGVLLTDEVIKALNELPLRQKATFQITLDGNREVHDETRVGINKKPTYDIILSHIASALKQGNIVHVRFNYTYNNILTFYDVLEDFKNIGLNNYTNNLFVKFEHVWQDAKNLINSLPLMEEVHNAFVDAGFCSEKDTCHHRHVCYADLAQNAVINYNGDMFKCTARDFAPESKEGILKEDGHIYWNEKYEKRMKVRYSNAACRQCVILPICNGSCTQNKLEANNTQTCYSGRTEKDKQDYLKVRIEEIILNKQREKAAPSTN